MQQLGVGKRLAGLDEAGGFRLGANPFTIDTAAVVLDRDDHFAAGLAGRKRHRAGFDLAGGKALGGRFEAVIDRVAHQMHQRIGQTLDDCFVDFGALALRHQFDHLAGFAGEIMDEAAETGEQGGDRHHAQHHHRVPQFAGEAFDFFRNGA